MMVDSAKYNQVRTKNLALKSINEQGGKGTLTSSPSSVEYTARQKAEQPGEPPGSITSSFSAPKGLTTLTVILIVVGALGLFYLALKKKWIRV
jgi:hypothetical protein